MTTLDIFVDPVCPWCLLGKVRLQKALEQRPDHSFALAWRPFQLNPKMPAAGMARNEYLRARFGADAQRIELPVIQAAQEEGIPLDLAAIQRMPNTTDAHRLLYWAGLEECQTTVMDAILAAYWYQGRDIGQHSVLADIGGNAGMDRTVIERLLASDADRDTVAERETHARERGINAVPTFIIGNKYVMSGAQTTQTWLDIVDDLVGPAPAKTRH